MSIGKLIRNAETSKVPVMCVVGGREAEAGTLAVRTYRDGEVRSCQGRVCIFWRLAVFVFF